MYRSDLRLCSVLQHMSGFCMNHCERDLLTSGWSIVLCQVSAKDDRVRQAQKLWKKGGAAAILVASHKRLQSSSVKVLEVDQETVC